MTKFLFKLAVVAVGIFLLMQVPYFAKFRDELKASLLEKVTNVSTEIDRIQEKITGAEKVIDDTKQKVTDITEKVTETGKGISDAFTTIGKTADELQNVVTNEPPVPEGATPSPTSPKLPPPPAQDVQ